MNPFFITIMKKRGYKFLQYHFISVIIFGILYWLEDIFYSYYPKLAKSLYLGENDGPPADTLLYYLWFSLITQTTVGYSGISQRKGGKISFTLIKSPLFKILNYLQLCSIFIITALFI